MRIVATIEARMTSSRLPGKVLLPARGRPLLAHLVERLRHVPSLQGIVLATTTNQTDDVLADFAKQEGIACYRGSEDDVTGRVIQAAESVDADVVVETTGDCPLLDFNVSEQVIRTFLGNRAAYAFNSLELGYPDGTDTVVFKLETLKRSYAMTSDSLDREHVTRHFQMHPDLFPGIALAPTPDLSWPGLALTLDEPKDYELIKRIIDYFGEMNPLFTCREILALLRSAHPEWVSINQGVKRKGLN